MLPAEQEADEVPGRNRLDLAPLALPAVRVNAGQHPPGAPFLGPVRVGEPAPQREALVLQPDKGKVDGRPGQRRRPGQFLRRARTRHVQVPAQHLRRRGFRLHGLDPQRRRHRHGPRGGVQVGENRHPFGRTPQPGRDLHRPPARGQLPEPSGPLRPWPHHVQRHQQVVQLVRVPRLRPDLLPDLLDRVRVEPGQVAGVNRQPAGDLHLAAAPVPGLRLVVQIGERRPVQYLVSEHRGLGGVPGDDGDPARLDPGHQFPQPLDVHRLVQAVLQGLPDQRVVGDLHRARRHVLLARGQHREHRRHQVVGLHPLDGRRVLPPAAHPQDGQRGVQVPPPPGLEERSGQHGLPDDLLHRLGGEELRHLLQGEAVLRPEREQDGVVAGRRLQLEVERDAEPLAQGQAEGAVHPRAEWCVPDQLHPARLVEEALQDDRVHGWQRPERGQPGPQVGHDGLGRGPADAALLLEPLPGLGGLPVGYGLPQR